MPDLHHYEDLHNPLISASQRSEIHCLIQESKTWSTLNNAAQCLCMTWWRNCKWSVTVCWVGLLHTRLLLQV